MRTDSLGRPLVNHWTVGDYLLLNINFLEHSYMLEAVATSMMTTNGSFVRKKDFEVIVKICVMYLDIWL